MPCPRCGADLDLKQRIDFPHGPAKLVFECALGHVSIADAPEQPPSS